MKIDHYIVRGGENLNSPARKTPGFPSKAETLFEKWHSKLGKDDREEENCFEMPVDGQTRLFLRSFWVEKPGHRPVCYYVGLLIERDTYMRAQEYFKLHKGICHISWQDIESAMECGFAPIEFPIDFPVPSSTIGLDFSQLSQMRFYGDEFDKNISEMCLSISVNSIEDWFDRLFIAVNPDRLDPAFHTVVSRKSPPPAFKVAIPPEKPPVKEKASDKIHIQRGSHSQFSNDARASSFSKPSGGDGLNWRHILSIICSIGMIIIAVVFLYSILQINNLHEKITDLYALNIGHEGSIVKKVEELGTKVEELGTKVEELGTKVKTLEDKLNNLPEPQGQGGNRQQKHRKITGKQNGGNASP